MFSYIHVGGALHVLKCFSFNKDRYFDYICERIRESVYFRHCGTISFDH